MSKRARRAGEGFALPLDKIGGTSTLKGKAKKIFPFPLQCIRFALPLDKIDCTSTLKGKAKKIFPFPLQCIRFALPLQWRKDSGPQRFDRDTHQLKNENRDGLPCQWRATAFPLPLFNGLALDTKGPRGGEDSRRGRWITKAGKSQIFQARSFITSSVRSFFFFFLYNHITHTHFIDHRQESCSQE